MTGQTPSAILAPRDSATHTLGVFGRVMSKFYFPLPPPNRTNNIFSPLCCFLPLSPSPFLLLNNPSLSLQHISLPLPLTISPFPGPVDCHCYLPNIVWQRSGIFYWLKIKVAKSPPRSPPLLLAALKNRGKHQFLAHQWRLHNQLKKTLVWGCKSYLCLIRAFRRCMSGFNVMK